MLSQKCLGVVADRANLLCRGCCVCMEAATLLGQQGWRQGEQESRLAPNTHHLPLAALPARPALQGRAVPSCMGVWQGQPRCPPASPQAVPEPAGCTAGLVSKRSVFLAAPKTGLASRANSSPESIWVMPGQEHSRVQILCFFTVWTDSF